MQVQFNWEKHFYFDLLSLIKQFLFKLIQFSISTDPVLKQFYVKQFSLV